MSFQISQYAGPDPDFFLTDTLRNEAKVPEEKTRSLERQAKGELIPERLLTVSIFLALMTDIGLIFACISQISGISPNEEGTVRLRLKKPEVSVFSTILG